VYGGKASKLTQIYLIINKAKEGKPGADPWYLNAKRNKRSLAFCPCCRWHWEGWWVIGEKARLDYGMSTRTIHRTQPRMYSTPNGTQPWMDWTQNGTPPWISINLEWYNFKVYIKRKDLKREYNNIF
jgi:hypothetical protein